MALFPPEQVRHFAKAMALQFGCTLQPNNEAIDEAGVVRAIYLGYEETKNYGISLRWKLLQSIEFTSVTVNV